MNARRFAGVLGTAPEAIVSRLATCVRSGPNLPVAIVPATVWQLMQAVCWKTVRPSATPGVVDGWLLLVRDPGGELGRRIGIHADQHLGVLRSAVLRALAQIEPWRLGIDPHGVDPVGNQVHLAGEPRNPEAVIGVGR